MEKTFKITMGNGRVLEGLRLNGNNYISEEELTEQVFSDEALRRIVIFDGEISEIKEDMTLIQLKQYGGEWWFILSERSPEEKERADLMAEIEAQAQAIEELAAIIGGEE